ncbi:CerR family C-terminal domain-containing protein [Novosphingobium album (ex Liu et al. 2023)]|uniref:CerR family C-terminal domain-containing protein n=1 Tax=Novosphingobium album (ex Liu et al. 2023) TaxID=3031130 RepID=A0ABT5WRA7_9SPHN|nr:CerR family C-terminal domain-containing protein [Novosphingobium album (ex Liu et al. 2023)]MDE8652561.1 CerR family C-terminal domain-containing protein [Novosphingobium album (ex Liu et al. 2023)]
MLQDRLLETAIAQFGQHGFEGASTRDIASASGTAMSSITYHFGGKEGLYLAAADHIALQIREQLGPLHDRVDRALPLATREEAVDLLLMLADGFARLLLRRESEAWSRFIGREQQQPTEAFERLYQGAMKAMIDTVLALLARCRPDLPETERRAMAVLLYGQALILRVGRASVCRIMGGAALNQEDEAMLRARLARNVRCILSEDMDG